MPVLQEKEITAFIPKAFLCTANVKGGQETGLPGKIQDGI